MKVGNISNVISDSNRLFEWLLLLGMSALLGLWTVEHTLNVITSYDQIGYPLALLTAGACYALCTIWKQHKLAKVILFVFMAFYMVSLTVFSFVLVEDLNSIYPMASTLQWMPIIYVVGFLTLSNRQAAYSAICIYSLLVVLLALAHLGFFSVENPELKALLLNSAMSHAVYIFCMFGIIKLKQTKQDSESKALEMEKAANIDGLLGIANRRHLQGMLDTCCAHRSDYSILLLDIDHFKSINDTFGHMAGDQVLREIVRCVRDKVLPEHEFGRWGGEEFLVLAKNTQLSSAIELAEAIRTEVEGRAFSFVGKVTVSIGVAESNPEHSANQVFEQADNALYKAKESGRNCVVIA